MGRIQSADASGRAGRGIHTDAPLRETWMSRYAAAASRKWAEADATSIEAECEETQSLLEPPPDLCSSSEEDEDEPPNEQSSWLRPLLLPSLSNMLVGYNMSIVEWALQWLQAAETAEKASGELHAMVLSAALAGCIIGMIGLGAAGDMIGRKKSLFLTLAIALLGVIGCAVLTGGSHKTEQLVFWRFVAGVGMGGVYPLAAVTAAETSSAPAGR